MKLRFMVLCFLFSAAPAIAHSDKEAPDAAVLNCEHPPAELVKTLPKQIAVVAMVTCEPAAQVIVAGDGWVWRFPGSFFDRPSIPAYSPLESRSNASGRYFTGLRVKELTRVELEERHKEFAKSLVTYTDTAPPARMLKLAAKNDQGHTLDAYFGFRTEREGWVIVCAPECAPEFLFLMQKND